MATISQKFQVTRHMSKINSIPIVAIIGKPNVGKSTFFNALIGQKIAIVSDIAGTTRDRIYSKTDLGNLEALMVDTGGLQYGKKENIESDVYTQALLAMEEADLIIFLVDGSSPPDISDEEAIKLLRKKKKDIIFVANKVDRAISQSTLPEFYRCGLGAPIEISAVHKRNIDEVRSILEKKLRAKGFRKVKKEISRKIKMAIIGRPNVGKSSVANALLGEKKIIVSNIPGTTRDAIDTELAYKNQNYILIDTAGIRRKGKIGKRIEYWSMLRGLRALEECDIAVLVLDATEGVVKQDEHIGGYILDERKGLIIVLNKIDLIEDENDREKMLRRIQRRMPFLPWAPIIMASALTGENIKIILDLAQEIMEERKKEIPQKRLQEFMDESRLYHSAKTSKKIPLRLVKMEQVKTNPPTFVIKTNDPEAIHFSYRRYLERRLREQFGFNGTAISLIFEKQRTKPKA